jgi:hypothetical protein
VIGTHRRLRAGWAACARAARAARAAGRRAPAWRGAAAHLGFGVGVRVYSCAPRTVCEGGSLLRHTPVEIYSADRGAICT